MFVKWQFIVYAIGMGVDYVVMMFLLDLKETLF